MDMSIAGSGTIGAGEYDNIKISGSAKVVGPVRCKNLSCSGSARCEGDMVVSDSFTTSGSARIEGNLQAGSIAVSGSARIEGNCACTHTAEFSGSLKCEGNIKANTLRQAGAVSAANIEAEDAEIHGLVNCQGLVNAEKLTIEIHGSGGEIGSIGGSVINISLKNDSSEEVPGFLKIFFKKQTSNVGTLVVKDSVEGDEITLDHVHADTVIGKTVKIGAGCKIRLVQYSEGVEISPDAQVETKSQTVFN